SIVELQGMMGEAAIVMRDCEAWIQGECLAEVGHGLASVAGPLLRQAAIVVSECVFRIETDRLGVTVDRLPMFASLQVQTGSIVPGAGLTRIKAKRLGVVGQCAFVIALALPGQAAVVRRG